MKKLFALFSFALLFLISVNTISAQASRPAIYPNPGGDTLSGEQHNYSLILKGNGNAVVLGRIDFSNNTEASLKSYSLEIPGVNPENFVAFQEISTPVCKNTDPNCLQIQIYPYPTKTDYKKLTPTINGSKVTTPLSEEVKVASSSGLVISYNSTGYTKGILGKYDFHFETPKIRNSIQNLNISIDTDNKSLYLKVDNETVNYNSPTTVSNAGLEAKSADSLAQIVPNIGNGGRVYKSVTNLTPGETVKLKGSYSTSILALNLDRIALFVVILLPLVLLVAGFLRSKVPAELAASWVGKVNKDDKNVVLIDFLVGVFSSSLIFGSAIFLKYFFSSPILLRLVESGPDFTLGIILTIFIVLFFGTVLLLPGILLGLRFGWKHLLFYILFEFFILAVILVGYTIIFLNSPSQNYPYPVPLGAQEKTMTN